MKRPTASPESEAVHFERRAASACSCMASCDHPNVTEDIHALKQIVVELVTEVQSLRRERLPDAAPAIEELCASIWGVFGGRAFSAKHIVELTKDRDQTAVRLKKEIERLIGKKASPKKLSHFLTRSIGVFGPWRLLFHKDGSREGNMFRITYPT